MSEKYEKDKVYLQQKGKGTIWEYDSYLAKQPGFEKVVPNPSKEVEEDKDKASKKSKK